MKSEELINLCEEGTGFRCLFYISETKCSWHRLNAEKFIEYFKGKTILKIFPFSNQCLNVVFEEKQWL